MDPGPDGARADDWPDVPDSTTQLLWRETFTLGEQPIIIGLSLNDPVAAREDEARRFAIGQRRGLVCGFDFEKAEGADDPSVARRIALDGFLCSRVSGLRPTFNACRPGRTRGSQSTV